MRDVQGPLFRELEPLDRWIERQIEQDAVDYHITDLLADSMCRSGARITGKFRVQPLTATTYRGPSGSYERTAVNTKPGHRGHFYSIEADGADFCGRMWFSTRAEAAREARRLSAELRALSADDWSRLDREADEREAALDAAGRRAEARPTP